MTPRPRYRSLLINLAVMSVSLVFVLLVVEIVLRKIPRDPPIRYAAAFFKMDYPKSPKRLRDFRYDMEKKEGQFRIMAVGDSFTRGAGVNFDDTWVKRLERYLNYTWNGEEVTYQILNMGIYRRSTPEEVAVINNHHERVKPDLVILAYVLNDTEDWTRGDEVLKLRESLYVDNFQKPGGWKGRLYRRSTLARLVFHRLHNERTFRGQIKYYRALYSEDSSGWLKTREALESLPAFTNETGIPVVVVIFPLFSFGLDDEYPFQGIHRQLHKTLKGSGVLFLDLRKAYKRLDRVRLEAVPYTDPHPSEIAQRIAAEQIWWYLIEGDLIRYTPGKGDPRQFPPIPSPY